MAAKTKTATDAENTTVVRKSSTETAKKPKQKRTPRSPDKQILASTNPVGRPTKLSDEVESKICAAIRGGNYIETAAAYAGVTKETLYTWLKEGAAKKSHELTKFSDSVKKSLAESEMIPLSRIAEAGKISWQAEAWRLERRFPDRWAKRPDAQVNIQTGKEGETKITLGALYKQMNETDCS